jgi:hypothetical protein
MEINQQYYMYGIIVSYDWYEKWKNGNSNTIISKEKNLEFDENEIMVDNVSCVFYGRENKLIIIGKIIKKFETEAILVKELNSITETKIRKSVKNNFDLDGDFNYYFIKTFKK